MMDAQVVEKLNELEARIIRLESVLADIEDAGFDPIVSQHREFAAMIRARREAQE
jgi:hypothetical protein